MSTKHTPGDYFTLPIEQWTVRDLTDALGVDASVKLLNSTRRSLYTSRNKSIIGRARLMRLIDAVRANEIECRSKLVALRNRDANRVAVA